MLACLPWLRVVPNIVGLLISFGDLGSIVCNLFLSMFYSELVVVSLIRPFGYLSFIMSGWRKQILANVFRGNLCIVLITMA